MFDTSENSPTKMQEKKEEEEEEKMVISFKARKYVMSGFDSCRMRLKKGEEKKRRLL